MSDKDKGRQIGRLLSAQARMAAKNLGADVALTAEETEDIAIAAALSPIPDGGEWTPGQWLAAGTVVTREGVRYAVIQGHIAQADWPPESVPALFETAKEEYAEWDQPLGAHDAYMRGDKVTHNGKRWESTLDNNVWEPGVAMWNEMA